MKLKLPFKRKKTISRPAPPKRVSLPQKRSGGVTTRYSDIAKQRKRAIWRNRLNDIKIKLPIKSILIVLVIIIVAVVILVLRNSAFNIKEINVIAPPEILEQVTAILESYKGQNIYLVRESEVSEKIRLAIPEIERSYLYKEFPDKILVESVQGDPALILATLNSVSLLDENGSNIGSFGGLQKIELTTEEDLLFKGELDIHADIFKNKYLEGKTDQEKLAFDWTQVPPEEKQPYYNQFREQTEQKVAGYFASVLEIYSKSVYNSLPLIQSYYIEDLEPEDINLAIDLVDGMTSRGIRLTKNFLSTKFTLDLTTEENKLIRLSLRRSAEDQIKEMDTVIYHGFFSSAKIIDLRSNTYSITR